MALDYNLWQIKEVSRAEGGEFRSKGGAEDLQD